MKTGRIIRISDFLKHFFVFPELFTTHLQCATYGIGQKFQSGKPPNSGPYPSEIFGKCSSDNMLPTLRPEAMANVPDQLVVPNDSAPLDWSATVTDTNKRTRQGVKLSMHEVRFIIEIWELPPFLSLEQAAQVCNSSPSTLKNQTNEGRFPRSAMTGKPLRFVTTRFIQEIAARLEGQS